MELKIRVNPQNIIYFVPTHELAARQIEKKIKRAGAAARFNKISRKIISLGKSYSNGYIDFENLPKTKVSDYPRYIKTQEIVSRFSSGDALADCKGGGLKTPELIASIKKNGVLPANEMPGYSYKTHRFGFGEHSLFGIGPQKEIFKVDKGETRFYVARALQLESFPVVFCYIDKSHHDEVASVGLNKFIESLDDLTR
ncbi:hypothetical protein [Roseinatronobacter sp. S2]|uniref:hypothetical protein n=1 Tax=Roseinatronobacter sp. S2 TaxID=3035471 RepID=UPI0024105765|nr:hypothetical protein [Roseinatronobacter sp. S2]WFE74183.1 hypothetical protein P8S53_13470 [Roseinatronobacter sp. S2]